jgi:Bacteriophage baseplate protein W
MASEFLGTGWKFPVSLDNEGKIALARYDESIRQAIWIILSTAPGERVMRPDFGCGIQDLVFAVNSAGTAGRVASLVRQALVRWEPRIDVLNVSAFPDASQPSLLQIEIEYRIRATNSRFNLVYPFYLERSSA